MAISRKGTAFVLALNKKDSLRYKKNTLKEVLWIKLSFVPSAGHR